LRQFYVALLGFALFACAVTATSLKSNVDTAYMYSDQTIQVYYWVVNTDYQPAYASFTADLGDLNGYFGSPFVTIDRDGAKGTYFYVSAPDCMRGAQTVHVRSRVCDYAGVCKNYYTQLTVDVTPAKSCRVMVNASYEPPQYYEPMPPSCAPCPECVSDCNSRSSGGCCNESVTVSMDNGYVQYSTVTYSRFYDPTEFEVRVSGADGCKAMRAGEWARVPLTLKNYGAAGTFDLRLIGDKDKVNAVLSNNYASLVRNGLQEVFVDVQPSRMQGGRYWTTLQMMKDGVVVAEKDVCVDVEDVKEARVFMPSSVKASACDAAVVKGTVQNTGTDSETFSLLTAGFASVTPSEVTLKPGEQAEFSVQLDTGKLESNAFALLKVGAFDAETGELRGEANASVFVESCAAAGGINASAQQEADFVKLVVEIDNPQPKALENVTVEVLNLPQGWQVLSEGGFSVQPNAKRNATVWIRPSSGDEASPLVVVKSNGQIVATKELPKIRGNAGGLTGMVTTALSQNALLIALLVFVALLVIVLSGRRKSVAASPTERQEKLADLKESVEKEGE